MKQRYTNYPMIVTFPNKSSGDLRYLAHSDEDIAKICYKMLITRVQKNRYWHVMSKGPERQKSQKLQEIHASMTTQEHAFVDLSEDAVKSLPEPIRMLAEIARGEYAQKTLEIEYQYIKNRDFYNGLSRVLDASRDLGTDENGWSLKNDKGQYLCIDLINSRRHEPGEEVEFYKVMTI